MTGVGLYLIADRKARQRCWVEHFSGLLNHPQPTARCDDLDSPEHSINLDVNDSAPNLDEVAAAVKRLRSGKAAGADSVYAEFFKHSDAAVEKLHALFREVWEQKTLPRAWQLATVLPFFKKGDNRLCSNYRGISLLSIGLKVLESIVLHRLRPAYESHARENQCGFRPGRGCIDQIFVLRQILERRHEFRQPTVACFVDFAAAFDSVDRNVLWKIAEAAGAPRNLLEIMRAMYAATESCVRVYGSTSEPFEISTGVRQGSILSPWLFNLCLDYVLSSCIVPGDGVLLSDQQESLADLAYADDIVLLAESVDALQRLLDR